MNTKRIIYSAAALALMGIASSCEQEDIYQPLDFAVRLSASNTYLAGDPVVFEFDGNADFITAWNGDTGHEYRYRNRTSVAMEDIESCELTLELQQRYGDADAATNNLDLFAKEGFRGLAGNDADADRTLVEAIRDSGYAGWDALPFTPDRSSQWVTYTYDITPYAGNFSFGMRFHHDPAKAMRTYWMEPRITVRFKGYDTQSYSFTALKFESFSLAAKHAANPYKRNPGSGNGWLYIQGEAGSNSAASIVFQGFNAGASEGPIDQWAFLQPMALNRISPDTGTNIKGVADDIRQYSHKYAKPGTYTATFIVSNGNYAGESQRVIREVTFTVIPSLGE